MDDGGDGNPEAESFVRELTGKHFVIIAFSSVAAVSAMSVAVEW